MSVPSAVPIESGAPRRMTPRIQAPLGVAPFHEWGREDEGGAWLSFHRVADGFLLRFPDMADFLIAPDGSAATCWPVPGTDDGTLEHLFLNQVLPMIKSACGHLVFHAGVVEVPGRRAAIALFGASGRGKSTLAASFALAGERFLTDDMLVLMPGEDGMIAQPSHPSIRLWHDSRDAVLGNAASLAPAVSYTEKDRLLAAENLPHCPEPRPLAAAFFLGQAQTEAPVLRPLRGTATLAAWMENVFVLDIDDRALVRRNLDAVAETARAVPSFALEYPRRYDALPEVRRAILAAVPTAGETS